VEETTSEVTLRYPNREKAESKASKFAIVIVLLISAALIAIITAGGWAKLEGAQIVSVFYVVVYLVMAYYVSRWNRGVLPLAAALAVIFTTFAVVAAPAWFARDKAGLVDPALPPSVLGMLTIALIVVQLLLIFVSMRGFAQQWQVEIEVHDGYEIDSTGKRTETEKSSVAGGWA
jgi:lysylphosphatidylglycerol synthetase-like protein (DUF2156 family)